MKKLPVCFGCALLLGLALLLPPSARSQAQPFQGVEAGQVFDLNFDSGQFLQTLPFDVWFFVQFDRAGANSALGRIAQTEPVNCNQADFSDTRSLDLGIASIDKAKDKFLVPVPALQPNRSYCFKFTRRSSPSPTQTTAFQVESTREIERALQAANLSTLQQPGPYNDLRLRLVGRVEDILSPAVLVVPPDSFFNKNISLVEVGEDRQAQFNEIVNEVGAVRGNLEDFRDSTFGPETSAALADLASRVRAFTPELDQAKLRSPALRNAFQELPPEAVELPQRTEDELDLIALGLDPSTPTAINFGRISSAEGIQPLRERLTATLAAITSLRRFFSSLDNRPLATEAGLQGAAAQARIRGIIDSATRAGKAVQSGSSTLGLIAETLQQKTQALGKFVEAIQAEFIAISIARGSTLAPFEVRAGWYISMDAGLGVASEVTHKSSAVNDIFTYVGANVYFRPVNKKAHLRPLRDYPASQRRDEVLKRFAITFGVPTDPLDTPSELSGVIQNNPLILGGGYRLSDSFRTALGALIFKEKDSNPTINKERFSVVPFLSFSVDFNVRGLFSRLGGAFAGSNPGVASPLPGPAVQEIPKQ